MARQTNPKSTANLSPQTSERAKKGAENRGRRLREIIRYVERLKTREIVEHESFVELVILQKQDRRIVEAVRREFWRMMEENSTLRKRLEVAEKRLEKLEYLIKKKLDSQE